MSAPTITGILVVALLDEAPAATWLTTHPPDVLDHVHLGDGRVLRVQRRVHYPAATQPRIELHCTMIFDPEAKI